MRRVVVVVGLLLLTSGTAGAAALPNQLKVSGQTEVMIIDVDDNGILGDNDDCVWTASTDGSNLLLIPNQPGSSPPRLRACLGPCSGFGFVDSSEAGASITECDWDSDSPGAPFVPACMEFESSVPDSSPGFCSASNPSAGAREGGAQGNGLAHISAGRLFYPGFEFLIPEPGFGFLCNAGGPAVQVRTIGGRDVVTDITFLGGSPPTHACVAMPFEVISFGRFLFKACLPLAASGNIEFSVDDDPPFAEAPLTGLPACGVGRTAAPSASNLGLLTLALGMLALGAWTLGRRSGFARSLPLL